MNTVADIPEIVLHKIRSGEKIRLELGCGPNKPDGFIGVDKLPLDGVDIVYDAENGLGFLPDSCVDEISSSHFLEHITNFEELMREIHRVLKPGGIHKVVVPHFSNPFYYSDYTHKRFFGLYTFDYFAVKESCLSRGKYVPDFYNDFKFYILERKLNIRSSAKIRKAFKSIFRGIFNMNNWFKEFYEENFCWIIPCYDITFVMKPVK